MRQKTLSSEPDVAITGDESSSDEFKSVEFVSVSPSGTEGDEVTSSEVRSTKFS